MRASKRVEPWLTLPVALVNKLVSLSNHPSSKILKQFALGTLGS